jgi:hypothetical protein
MTSLKDSAIRNIMGTGPLLLLFSDQAASLLKARSLLGLIAVGVFIVTCT